jgi:transketolase
MLPGTPAVKREGVLRGGYVLMQESAPLNLILIGTGSEVQHAVAVAAAPELGPGTRVVSLPCFSRFERQPADYREAALPAACERRVSIEAGVTFGWRAFVGTRGRMVGIDHFGASAPGNEAHKHNRTSQRARSVVRGLAR